MPSYYLCKMSLEENYKIKKNEMFSNVYEFVEFHIGNLKQLQFRWMLVKL